MPMVNNPNKVPAKIPVKAIPILKIPPSLSITKTNAKHKHPIENTRHFIVVLACFSVACGKNGLMKSS
jgi:hypothetical protein